VDSRAAPKAAGVSGGSPAGKVYPHGWQCWPFRNRLVQLEHMESSENRIAQARQVMCRRRVLRRLARWLALGRTNCRRVTVDIQPSRARLPGPKGDAMEVRYLGFERQQSARSYQFDVVEKGQRAKRVFVTTDLSLFHTHGVGIQEGPALSASKLVADLERDFAGAHELTAEDLLSYVNARFLAEARRAEMRRAPRRRPSPAAQQSPWRGSRA